MLFDQFILISLCTEVIAGILNQQGMQNHHVYNVYLMIGLSLTLLFLGKKIPKKLQPYCRFPVYFFLAGALLNILFLQGPKVFNNYTLMAGALIVVLYSLLVFRTFFLEPREGLHKQPLFWINSGVFIFYSGSFLFFAFVHLITRLDQNIAMVLLQFLNMLNIVVYSLYLTAYLCLIPRSKFTSSSS